MRLGQQANGPGQGTDGRLKAAEDGEHGEGLGSPKIVTADTENHAKEKKAG